MKQHLVNQSLILALFTLCVATGCRTTPSQPTIAPVPAKSFARQWQADLHLAHDPVTQIFLRDKLVLAYTTSNKGYWIGSAGGDLKAINQITAPDYSLRSPVLLTDQLIIPTTASFETFDHEGRHINSFPTTTAIQSSASGSGNALYIGVLHPGSGRLARYDVGTSLTMAWEMYTTAGIISAPAIIGDAIYAGGVDGRVWAVTAARDPLWALENNSFKTDGAITADLAADDYGVYVASHDNKLYCLDRLSGKLKWAFYAGRPLLDPPVVLGNIVYQLIPDRGLAAINKTEGKLARDAMWVQPAARQILASDEKNLYVRMAGDTLAALDKTTGQLLFTGQRSDLKAFATAPQSPLIYAATLEGRIMAIRPILKPGFVGQPLNDAPAEKSTSSAQGQ